jgi:hypothetical protein
MAVNLECLRANPRRHPADMVRSSDTKIERRGDEVVIRIPKAKQPDAECQLLSRGTTKKRNCGLEIRWALDLKVITNHRCSVKNRARSMSFEI